MSAQILTMPSEQEDFHGIVIDEKKNELLSEMSLKMLSQFYCNENETPQQAFARTALCFSAGDLELAQRLYDAVSKGWFMFASPVLSNSVLPGVQPKAMPISCFLLDIQDNLESIIDHSTEVRWLSVKGGGVGANWSKIRSVSNKAPGPMPFLHTIDADMIAYRQGKTRKGSLCAFLDISHPDIIEFMHMRVPTGDVNRKNLNLHHSINIPDEFMRAVERDEMWDLIDPHDETVRDTIRARELWESLLEIRYRTGEPCIHFITESNRHLPQALKDRGLRINSSNLCQEITLPTNEERTAVCCLSSLNLDKFDEWKDSTLVEDMITMLDNVLQFFIDHAPDTLAKARYSATRERSLGLGAMGFHSWLQKNNIAWESEEAREENKRIFAHIDDKAKSQTFRLGLQKGEYLDGEGTGRRNAHLTAIAPNANSGMLLGVSPSIEPYNANTFTQRSRIGSYLIKNPYLAKVLDAHGKNNDSTWSSIMLNRGSVSHLKFLTDHEKNVFKTAMEIDQTYVIHHAADRQQFIEQGQSVNLFFPAKQNKSELNRVHYLAWKKKLKTLYYLRTEAEQRVENVSDKVERIALQDYNEQKSEEAECLNCQG
ncbi:MAG: ribonucleoside-diphosphate reductase subunit alpha [Candidatus Poseidoniales archaeon]